MENKTFENALERLEEIVDKLETGELTLDESVKLFEEGINLSLFCQEQLEQADGVVQKLTQTLQGDFKLE